jgi:ABC-type nitrate/sulfonate/bicarbonate transport system permease component
MDKKQTLGCINKTLAVIITAPAVILILWEFLSRLKAINNIYFPAPTHILLRFIDLLFQDPKFLSDILFSLKRLALGVIISVPSAIALGLSIGLDKRVARFFTPLISITYPIPKLSILPLLMILLGIGDISKIAIIAIGIFYLVLLNVIHGIRGLPVVYFYIIKIYRIPFVKTIYLIILKGILPDILQGCKVGIGYGLIMVVASEFIAAKNGIGFFMWNAWDQFRIKDVYVGLAVFSLMGLTVFAFFDKLLSNLKWRDNSRLW